MNYNLAERTQEERDKINVDLAAAAVAFKERYAMPVMPDAVAREQPALYQRYFQERLAFYRQQSATLERLPYEPRLK